MSGGDGRTLGVNTGAIASTELLVAGSSSWVETGALPSPRTVLRGVTMGQQFYVTGNAVSAVCVLGITRDCFQAAAAVRVLLMMFSGTMPSKVHGSRHRSFSKHDMDMAAPRLIGI